MSFLEISGVVVSALAIWLTARRRVLCWPVSLASVVLYAWIFFDAKLYSDMLLQGAFAVLQIYGWWRWAAQRDPRDDAGRNAVAPVTGVGLRRLTPDLLVAVVISAALGSAMARWTDAALPYVDASLTAFSLVAQYWTARRFIASWWLWSAVNIVYLGMFIFKGLYLTSGLYALFLALAVIGWREWARTAASAAAAEPQQDLLPVHGQQ
ncbi:nicotinamide riboside transporter PnuC [Paraburkholderia sp. BR10882]|uniref:nicotinamide riboside transporter PnuC n=1 Tax=unclassified Paraburkholderia TaxID=2615204 RepID=UPI0034D00C86